MHVNCELMFEKYAQVFFKSNMRILEIGPWGSPSNFCRLINNATIEWETLDISPLDNPTYISEDGFKFPVPDEKFDIVFSANTIEHVKKPWVWIKEVARVTKAGGHVITITPISWPYHEAPVDCWRIYPEGMKALYEEAGLGIVVNKFETLEATGYRKLVPGVTSVGQKKFAMHPKVIIMKLLGWPIQCAYDTITIGVK